MPDDRVKKRLNQMNRRLYARNRKARKLERSRFRPDDKELRTDWGPKREKKSRRFKFSGLHILLIVSVVFFLIAVLVTVFSFTSGRNVISPDNVDIIIKGPVSVKGGEEVTLQLEITNNNSVDLESVDLQINYPPGTRSAENINTEQLRYTNFLDTIESGETIKETVKVVLFGDENEDKVIAVRLEYRTAGSSALVPVLKNYTVVITSAPVNVSLSVPDETNTGKEVPVEVTVTSNSAQVIEDVFLELDLPDGFSIITAEPSRVFGKNLWNLGDLPPGISRTIKIRGGVEADENDSLSFTAIAGLRRDENDRGVSIIYSTDSGAIFISPAAIVLDIALNGSVSDEYISNPGSGIRGLITWINRLPAEVRDGELTLTFSGPILNQGKVVAREGFYQSANNTIVWRPQGLSSLTSLISGEDSEAEFDFEFISSQDIQNLSLINPTLDIGAVFTAVRTSSGFEGQSVRATDDVSIKLQSQLRVLTQGSYTGGIFANTGPIPPRVGQETTYTITWAVTDTFNEVEDVVVRATLPTYVEWLNLVSDTSEDISYDSTNGSIIWKVGDLNPGVGNKFPAKEISFQVAITPSLTQFDEILDLIGDTTVTGTDGFTRTQLTGTSRRVSTGNIIGFSNAGRVAN